MTTLLAHFQKPDSNVLTSLPAGISASATMIMLSLPFLETYALKSVVTHTANQTQYTLKSVIQNKRS